MTVAQNSNSGGTDAAEQRPASDASKKPPVDEKTKSFHIFCSCHAYLHPVCDRLVVLAARTTNP